MLTPQQWIAATLSALVGRFLHESYSSNSVHDEMQSALRELLRIRQEIRFRHMIAPDVPAESNVRELELQWKEYQKQIDTLYKEVKTTLKAFSKARRLDRRERDAILENIWNDYTRLRERLLEIKQGQNVKDLEEVLSYLCTKEDEHRPDELSRAARATVAIEFRNSIASHPQRDAGRIGDRWRPSVCPDFRLGAYPSLFEQNDAPYIADLVRYTLEHELGRKVYTCMSKTREGQEYIARLELVWLFNPYLIDQYSEPTVIPSLGSSITVPSLENMVALIQTEYACAAKSIWHSVSRKRAAKMRDKITGTGVRIRSSQRIRMKRSRTATKARR